MKYTPKKIVEYFYGKRIIDINCVISKLNPHHRSKQKHRWFVLHPLCCTMHDLRKVLQNCSTCTCSLDLSWLSRSVLPYRSMKLHPGSKRTPLLGLLTVCEEWLSGQYLVHAPSLPHNTKGCYYYCADNTQLHLLQSLETSSQFQCIKDRNTWVSHDFLQLENNMHLYFWIIAMPTSLVYL